MVLQHWNQTIFIIPIEQYQSFLVILHFSRWGFAIAQAAGFNGEDFIDAYLKNQEQANEEAVSSYPVAAALIEFMKNKKKDSMPVSQLLKKLEAVADRAKINTRDELWPKTADILSRRLKEVKSNLEKLGITFDIRHGGQAKIVTIENENIEDLLGPGRFIRQNEYDDIELEDMIS